MPPITHRFSKTSLEIIEFRIRNYEIFRISRKKYSFKAPTCLVTILSFTYNVAVSIEEIAKPLLLENFQVGCYVVLCSKCGPF